MKKLVYFGALALAASMVACSGSASHKGPAGFDSLYSTTDADSLLYTMGQASAADINSAFARLAMEDSTIDIAEAKKTFLEGLQYIFSADTSEMFLSGVGYGLQSRGHMMQLQKNGVNGDPMKFVEGFRNVLTDPGFSPEMVEALQMEVQYQQQKFEVLKARYDSLEIEHSDLSLANVKAGNDKLAELQGQGYTLDGSGIAYKIDEPGEGDQVKADDRVIVNYTIKHLDGRVIRNVPGNYPVSVEFVGTKGLSLGLQKLAKGGKATIYVPGRLAYGVAGERMGIQPNEMLIYEVEVVDVNPTGN